MTAVRQTVRPQGLSREERLRGKTDIARLLAHGKFGHESMLKFCWLPRSGAADGNNRLMVSVSKRFFKRAVKRNLLKRRLREAYRRSKQLLSVPGGCDLLIIYNSKEIAGYKELEVAVEAILTAISAKAAQKEVAEP